MCLVNVIECMRVYQQFFEFLYEFFIDNRGPALPIFGQTGQIPASGHQPNSNTHSSGLPASTFSEQVVEFLCGDIVISNRQP